MAGAFHIRLRGHSRPREDYLAAAESDIAGWIPAGAAEIARDGGSSTEISSGTVTAHRAPVARIPNPEWAPYAVSSPAPVSRSTRVGLSAIWRQEGRVGKVYDARCGQAWG